MPAENGRTDESRKAVLSACRLILRPLSRFLVRNGVGFREFSELLKEAIVDVVSNDYGIRGRPTNISRAAVLTGLTRKEVSRVRHSLNARSEEDDVPLGRPAQVLDAWYRSAGYQSPDGRPIDLPYDGEQYSFHELVREAGGDIPPRAMLKELLQAGSVVKLPDEKYRVVSKTFIPDPAEPEAIQGAGQAISDLLRTINNNLFVEPSSGAILERRVIGEGVSLQDARKFRRFATSEAEKLLDLLNDWITTQETFRRYEDPEIQTARIGLGVYIFEEESGRRNVDSGK